MKRNKGFTLIELIAVITILTVVALITIPAVNKAIRITSYNVCYTKLLRYKISIYHYMFIFNKKLKFALKLNYIKVK